MVIIHILKRKINLCPAAFLQSACLHLPQRQDRAEPLPPHLLKGTEREKVIPRSSWGRAAFWQDKHQGINHCYRKPKPLLVQRVDAFDGISDPTSSIR